MKINRKFILLMCLIVYSGFVMYKYDQRQNGNRVIKQQSKVKIVTSMYPLTLHTQALVKGTTHEVHTMTSSQAGCLHDYQLTVQDSKKLEQADMLVLNGLGAESFMDQVYINYKDLQVIKASEQYEQLIAAKCQDVVPQDDEYTVDEGHKAHSHHEAGAHDHDEINAHLWMSVRGSIQQVKQITKELQRLDPDNQKVYAANQVEYLELLNHLEHEMKEQLIELKGMKVVSVHDSFEYLMEELGIEIIAKIPEGIHESASAKQVEEIITTMRNEHIKVIITDKQYQEMRIVKLIAKETGAEIVVLDTILGKKDLIENNAYEYIVRMQENFQRLKELSDDE